MYVGHGLLEEGVKLACQYIDGVLGHGTEQVNQQNKITIFFPNHISSGFPICLNIFQHKTLFLNIFRVIFIYWYWPKNVVVNKKKWKLVREFTVHSFVNLQVGLPNALHAGAAPVWLPYTALDKLLLELREVQQDTHFAKVIILSACGGICFQLSSRIPIEVNSICTFDI